MTLALRFCINSRISCLYAAAAISHGRPLVDARLAAALHEPTTKLSTKLTGACGPGGDVWQQLILLAATSEKPTDWVQVSLKGATGQVPHLADVAELAVLFSQVEAAVLGVYPRLPEELPLRSRPLGEQWEAYAPGLWRQLARLTEGRPLANEATVLLVQPVCGGGGASYIPHNAVTFEAVLANPIPQLPEVLRLAWLLGQLGERAGRTSPFEALALVPAVLAAGAHVELARCDSATIQLALAAWLPELRDRDAVGTVLAEWWSDENRLTMDWAERVRGLSARLSSSISLSFAPE